MAAKVLASLGRGEEVEELLGGLEEGEQGLVKGLLAAAKGEVEQARYRKGRKRRRET